MIPLEAVHEKPYVTLIDCYVLLQNFLILPCEAQGESYSASQVT